MYMQSMYIRRFSSFQETSDPSQALCCKTEKDRGIRKNSRTAGINSTNVYHMVGKFDGGLI